MPGLETDTQVLSQESSPDISECRTPYIPWKSFENFVATLKSTHAPDVIDGGVMPDSMSGGLQRQIRTALKFLGLTNGVGKVSDRFNSLIEAHGTPQWPMAVKECVLDSYAPIVGDLVIVMDETDRHLDRQFVRRPEGYFTLSGTGKYRSARIVPSPFFVSSDMTYPVQAADVCIYCINHAFRIPGVGMDAPVRREIEFRFGSYLYDLKFEGDGYKEGQVFRLSGITYVPNPYGPGH